MYYYSSYQLVSENKNLSRENQEKIKYWREHACIFSSILNFQCVKKSIQCGGKMSVQPLTRIVPNNTNPSSSRNPIILIPLYLFWFPITFCLYGFHQSLRALIVRTQRQVVSSNITFLLQGFFSTRFPLKSSVL